MKAEPKVEILERRKEIEQEISDLLKKVGSDFTLKDIQKIILNETSTSDMMKIVSFSDRGGDPGELSDILELVSDAWNYFPHKLLDGKSPTEMY